MFAFSFHDFVFIMQYHNFVLHAIAHTVDVDQDMISVTNHQIMVQWVENKGLSYTIVIILLVHANFIMIVIRHGDSTNLNEN